MLASSPLLVSNASSHVLITDASVVRENLPAPSSTLKSSTGTLESLL
jgi:hypothetical protein